MPIGKDSFEKVKDTEHNVGNPVEDERDSGLKLNTIP